MTKNKISLSLFPSFSATTISAGCRDAISVFPQDPTHHEEFPSFVVEFRPALPPDIVIKEAMLCGERIRIKARLAFDSGLKTEWARPAQLLINLVLNPPYSRERQVVRGGFDLPAYARFSAALLAPILGGRPNLAELIVHGCLFVSWKERDVFAVIADPDGWEGAWSDLRATGMTTLIALIDPASQKIPRDVFEALASQHGGKGMVGRLAKLPWGVFKVANEWALAPVDKSSYYSSIVAVTKPHWHALATKTSEELQTYTLNKVAALIAKRDQFKRLTERGVVHLSISDFIATQKFSDTSVSENGTDIAIARAENAVTILDSVIQEILCDATRKGASTDRISRRISALTSVLAWAAAIVRTRMLLPSPYIDFVRSAKVVSKRYLHDSSHWPAAIPGSVNFGPISVREFLTTDDLHDIGCLHLNCLAEADSRAVYVERAMLGLGRILEVRKGRLPVLISLILCEDGLWQVDALLGPKNQPVRDDGFLEVADALIKFFSAHYPFGIPPSPLLETWSRVSL